MSVPSPAALPRLRGTTWPWLLATALLVVFRAWPFAWWGTLAFDADQAVVGLMAKHIAEFRALPVYQYALAYVVVLTAYVAAPFMWIFGPTVFALKLPLVLMNVGVATAAVVAVARAGLRPAIAMMLCLPLILPAAVTNAGLMDVLGMTVEPLLIVLLLWHVRRSPVAFGIVAAVGFHVREFVAYGVAAVLAVDLLDGTLLTRAGARHWLGAALAALGVAALLGGIARFASVRGPDTWLVANVEGNLATLGGAFCFQPRQAWRNVLELGASYLGVLWGPAPLPLANAAVQSRLAQGLPWAWPAFALVLLACVARLASCGRVLWARRGDALVQVGLFLTLVGTQAVLVYAISRCGLVTVVTIRYALLGVFLPTGLAVLLWAVEPRAVVRRAVGAAFVAVACLNAWTHARLWHEQVTAPVVSNRALLARALDAQGIRYGRSDYWTAYYVNFLTEERVIVGADAFSRIDLYERILSGHAGDVVRITTKPCGNVPAIAPGYYVCSATDP